MNKKSTYITRVTKLSLFIIVLYILIFGTITRHLPVNVHNIKDMITDTNRQINNLDVGKPEMISISKETYNIINNELNISHTYKVLDSQGRLVKITDRTINDSYMVVSGLNDNPDDRLNDYKIIMLYNILTSRLKLYKVISITGVALFVFLSLTFIGLEVRAIRKDLALDLPKAI